MAISFRVDQDTNGTGTVDETRDDLLGDGSRIYVYSLGAGDTHDFQLLWAPDDDATAAGSFTKAADHCYFDPDPTSAGGPYRVRILVTAGGIIRKRTITINVPTANGLLIPALNETASPSASLINSGASYVALSETNKPEASGPFAAGNYGGWYLKFAKLFRFVDSLATTVTALAGSSGDVTGPASAVAGRLAVYADTTGKLLSMGGYDQWWAPVDLASDRNVTLPTDTGSLDGVSVLGKDVLLWRQTTRSQNGIYSVDGSGNYTRRADLSTNAHIIAARRIAVRQGTRLRGSFRLLNLGATTLGTDSLYWLKCETATLDVSAASYTVVAEDCGLTLRCTAAACAVGIPDASTLLAGQELWGKAVAFQKGAGTGKITLSQLNNAVFRYNSTKYYARSYDVAYSPPIFAQWMNATEVQLGGGLELV